jgi:hypothetical protein
MCVGNAQSSKQNQVEQVEAYRRWPLTVIVRFPQPNKVLAFHVAEFHLLPEQEMSRQSFHYKNQHNISSLRAFTGNRNEQELDIFQLAQPPHAAERTWFTSTRES